MFSVLSSDTQAEAVGWKPATTNECSPRRSSSQGIVLANVNKNSSKLEHKDVSSNTFGLPIWSLSLPHNGAAASNANQYSSSLIVMM